MKKPLLLFIFFATFSFSISINAQQSAREVASISQKSDDGVLQAFPNPAKDFIILKSKDSNLKIKSVTFYSILGTEVAQFNVNKNSGEINLDRLKPGKYLMKYTMSDDTQKVTQIIKQ
ncbi:T9SS type A sorting domain-containing protein [Halpernia sp.]|uniref:T9SS type A sorting domain-containing protein n=1 Tax=Halpernia sp. TaxID=2782209 RepID=UPI003A8EDEB1